MNFARSMLSWAILLLPTTALAQTVIPPQLAKPNCILQVSRSIAAQLVDRLVDRVEPVDDNILKTDIHGTGHTLGQVTTEFVPNDCAGVIDLVMNAQNVSQTIGKHGPVQLYNTSTSSIIAHKRLYVDANGIWFGPAEPFNVTDNTLEGMSTRFRMPMLDRAVRKAAMRRYNR